MDFSNPGVTLNDPLFVGVIAAAIFLPIILITRKYSLPAILYVVEYTAYCVVAHLTVGGLTRTFSWFKSQTTFEALDDTGMEDRLGYTTPFNLDFWQKELYNPEWLFWLELGIAVALLYVVVMMRPLKFGGKNNRQRRLAKKKRVEQKHKAYANRHATARARR